MSRWVQWGHCCRLTLERCPLACRTSRIERSHEAAGFQDQTHTSINAMAVVVVTGACGLVGSASAEYFGNLGCDIVGLDNDMRRVLFGEAGSTRAVAHELAGLLQKRYSHVDADIRDKPAIDAVFRTHGSAITLVVHTAAQPSHDWAARDPTTDFGINAIGTLNLLEATRRFAPAATFIFTSTNKVYGDHPNSLPLIETASRWEIAQAHTYSSGVREDMSIDQTTHSLFGVSKVAADAMVQEYGRYFGMQTAAFRCGCLTGPRHAGVEAHGFLSYLVKCASAGTPYTIYGHRGKQVRDNLHCDDLVRAFHEFSQAPRSAEVYNLGGGRFSNTSVLEAIEKVQAMTGRQLDWKYSDRSRIGDHRWWITDNGKFMSHYPRWAPLNDIDEIFSTIYAYAGR
jgi:CDP-paratose 2-epimerase